MAKRTVTLKIEFVNTEENVVNLETDKVPLSLIVETLQNLIKGLCKQIVKDANEVVSIEELPAYLDTRIKVDREILNKLLNKL